MRFGMDYGGTNLKTGIFSEEGDILTFVEKKLVEFTDRGDLLTNLLDHAKAFTEDYTITRGGLAIKGLISSETGIMEDDIGAGSLLAGRDLRKPFRDALQIPFAVENDARAYAWGEWKFGAGKGSRVMVCMTFGTGLGCALVKDREPYQGSDALGGLLGGHISIDRNGPECPCGNRGCLEGYCSATAFAQRIKEAHPEFEHLDEPLPAFFAALEKMGQPYRATLRVYLKDLSIGIVNAIHAYGPDLMLFTHTGRTGWFWEVG
jgi:glucokinase